MQLTQPNRWLAIPVAAILIGAAMYLLWGQTNNKAHANEVGTAKLYSGRASVLRESREKQLENNSAVLVGDTIATTTGSRMSLEFNDGSIARIEEGSQVKIVTATFSEQGKIVDVQLELLFGKLWSKVEKLDQNASYKTETPMMTAAVRGTQYNLEHYGLRSALLVFSGEVFGLDRSNQGSHSEQLVKAGDVLIVDASQGKSEESLPRPQMPGEVDEWILFNLEEDNELNSKSEEQDASATEPERAPQNPTGSKPTTTNNPTNPSASEPIPQTTATLTSLNISPTKTSLNTGESVLFTVTAQYSDGSKTSPTTGLSWSQTNNIGAFQGNFFRGILVGTTDVKAALSGVQSNTVRMNVASNQTPTPTLSISCTKQTNPNSPNNLPRLVCYSTYQPGQQNVTDSTVWQASGQAAGSIDKYGVYTPEQQGSVTISAEYNNLTKQATYQIP